PSREQELTVQGTSREQEPSVQGPSREQEPTIQSPSREQELTVPEPSREQEPTRIDYTVVQINRHITSMINNSGKGEKRVMIILDLNVLAPGSQVGQKIGHPVPYVEGGSETCATVR
ncbi:unnamed protein product, partial [Timema podura]|nr:unnamed protein product [Timema podura]